jgi:DNA-directed RNA polymerase specialized sigma24 family protein
MDERQLIDRCIRGEGQGLGDLVREYGPAVHDAARFTLRRVLGSAQDEDVENVYQGVLLGLCDRDAHRLKLFQSRSSFRTWVTSVTVRFSLNYIRTEKRKGSLKYLGLDASRRGAARPRPDARRREERGAAPPGAREDPVAREADPQALLFRRPFL